MNVYKLPSLQGLADTFSSCKRQHRIVVKSVGSRANAQVPISALLPVNFLNLPMLLHLLKSPFFHL